MVFACWGSNNVGQSMPPAGTFTQVSAGQGQSCGVRTDGTTVACWGTGFPPPADRPDPGDGSVVQFHGKANRVGSGLANGKLSFSGNVRSVHLPDLV